MYPRKQDDLREEMQFHLDMEIEAGIRRGLSPEEARRQAVLKAGRLTQSLESVNDHSPFAWFEGLASDIRHAMRGLFRNKSFAGVAILVLAGSVAINTLIFLLLDGVVLRPLPYGSPERIVRVYETSEDQPKFPLAIARFHDFKASARAFDGIALYTSEDRELSGLDGRSERLTGLAVSSDYFHLLGRDPFMGSGFVDADLHSNVRKVVLSERLWRDRFASDPAIVGKTIRLDRELWTVTGVAARGFQHVGGDYRSPLQGETVDIWLPLAFNGREFGLRAFHYCNAVALLKPGFTIAQAREDLQRVASISNQRFPNFGKWNARVEPLLNEVTGTSTQVVWLLAGAGAMVLLIACFNIAGLCIARSLSRRREFELRRALGATGWHLLRAGLAENLIVGVVGASLGLAIAAAGLPLMLQIVPVDFPRAHEVRLTAEAAGFAAGIAVLTSLLAGLVPSARLKQWQSSQRTTSTRESKRLRSALVAAEIALAGLLCAGSLFLVRSFQEIHARNHGFDPAGVLTFQLSIPGPFYSPDTAALAIEKIRKRILEVPGVAAAGATTNLPWSGYDENSTFGIPGVLEEGSNNGGTARFQSATPGYFEAAGIRLIAGRFFDAVRDRKDQPLQIIVNDALVAKYLGGRNPIGTNLKLWGKQRQIAGVVAGIRDTPSDAEAQPAFWFPNEQAPFQRVFFAVKTRSADPASLTAAIASAVHDVDADLPVADVATLERKTRSALAARRFAMWLLQAFAVLGLSLAAAGTYGLLAYLVQQRRKELGIRLALGASRTDIWKMVLSDGLRMSAAGAVVCLALIPATGSLLKAFLYNVKTWDPFTIAGVVTVLSCVALLASASPAWSAARSDPAGTLRED